MSDQQRAERIEKAAEKILQTWGRRFVDVDDNVLIPNADLAALGWALAARPEPQADPVCKESLRTAEPQAERIDGPDGIYGERTNPAKLFDVYRRHPTMQGRHIWVGQLTKSAFLAFASRPEPQAALAPIIRRCHRLKTGPIETNHSSRSCPTP